MRNLLVTTFLLFIASSSGAASNVRSLQCTDTQGNRLSIYAGKHMTAAIQLTQSIPGFAIGTWVGMDLGPQYGRQRHETTVFFQQENTAVPAVLTFSRPTGTPSLPVGQVLFSMLDLVFEFNCQ